MTHPRPPRPVQSHSPSTITRRALLGSALAAGSSLIVSCTSSSPSAPSTDATGFAFDGPTSEGELIPVDHRADAPPVTGELLDGTELASDAYAGQVLVLNFWGSWCAPCRVETPEFQRVYADTGPQGAYFLGVAVKDQRQLAQAFYDDFGITYPSLFDPSGEVALAFRDFPANVVPTTILVDRSNKVAATYVAVVAEEELRRALETLLVE